MREDFPRENNTNIQNESESGRDSSEYKNGAEVLASMPSFEDHQKALQDQNADKPNESKGFKDFEKNHPELAAEMRQYNVPLNEHDFKAQGYGFYRDSETGQPHVKVATEEYKNWQSQHEEEAPSWLKRFENMRERTNRLKEEELRKNVESWTQGNAIESVYTNLFGTGLYGNKAEKLREEVPEITLKALDIRSKSIEKPSFATRTYELAFQDAFANSQTTVSEDEIVKLSCGRLNSEDNFSIKNTVLGRRGPKSGNYVYEVPETPKVVQEILQNNQESFLREHIVTGSNKLTPENIADAKKKAAISSINSGLFMQDAISKNPEHVDEVLSSIGIDKGQNKIVFSAINGCGKIEESNARESFASYFDLNNRVADVLSTEEGKLYFGVDKKGRLCRKLDGFNMMDPLPSEITVAGLARVEKASNDLVDAISNDGRYHDIISDPERLRRELESDVISQLEEDDVDLFDFDYYLDKTYTDYHEDSELRNYIGRAIQNNDLGYLVGKSNLLEKLGVANVKIDIDLKDAIVEGLKWRLEEGADEETVWNYYGSKRYPEKVPIYLADVFQSDDFLRNQERLGIDFADPEIAKIAFNGFIKTLETRNGEKSDQANWYYENIFANDPSNFLTMLKGFRESELCGRGTKAKITRFLNDNEALTLYTELQKRNDAKNNEHRVVKTSVLRKAEPSDIRKLIRTRQEELIAKIEDSGAEKIHTFDETSSRENLEGADEYRSQRKADYDRTPIDFGLEKINAVKKYYDFLDMNVPDSNPQFFVDTFPNEGQTENNSGGKFSYVKLDSTRSYIGFKFEYEGKLCAVAESFGDPAGMYLYCGELDSDYKKMFDLSKLEAEKDPNVAVVDHLDKDNFDDDLDMSYKKAFMFFRTGDKRSVLYQTFGGKTKWESHQDSEFPAWPLGIMNDYKEHAEDIRRYREWQAT